MNRHSDKVHITTGNSNGKDIWGMEEFQFSLGTCGRCSKTFIQGPTAFVTNINGPVRAIRFENRKYFYFAFQNKSLFPDLGLEPIAEC